jgi:hypothetical protein
MDGDDRPFFIFPSSPRMSAAIPGGFFDAGQFPFQNPITIASARTMAHPIHLERIVAMPYPE